MADWLPAVRAWQSRQRQELARSASTMAARRARLPEVARCLTEEFGVTEVILFGSLVDGSSTPRSDVDIAVRGLPALRYFDALARVAEILESDVDLVDIDAARPSLLQRIRETGEPVTRD